MLYILCARFKVTLKALGRMRLKLGNTFSPLVRLYYFRVAHGKTGLQLHNANIYRAFYVKIYYKQALAAQLSGLHRLLAI